MAKKIWDLMTSPGSFCGLFAVGCGEIAADLTPGIHGVGIAVYVASAFFAMRMYARWMEA